MNVFGATILVLVVVVGSSSGAVNYGEPCNGLLQQCNRYSETVLCMSRRDNETVGAETCEVGLGVDIGRCQCRRNCGSDGIYKLDGEFNEELQKCVGFVGKSCQIYVDCTPNASCETVRRICQCNPGYVPTSDGLRCRAA